MIACTAVCAQWGANFRSFLPQINPLAINKTSHFIAEMPFRNGSWEARKEEKLHNVDVDFDLCKTLCCSVEMWRVWTRSFLIHSLLNFQFRCIRSQFLAIYHKLRYYKINLNINTKKIKSTKMASFWGLEMDFCALFSVSLCFVLIKSAKVLVRDITLFSYCCIFVCLSSIEISTFRFIVETLTRLEFTVRNIFVLRKLRTMNEKWNN